MCYKTLLSAYICILQYKKIRMSVWPFHFITAKQKLGLYHPEKAHSEECFWMSLVQFDDLPEILEIQIIRGTTSFHPSVDSKQ